MIILDTNVVSEGMKTTPDPRVWAWLAAQDASAVAVTAVTMAELLYGIALLPPGRRRFTLATNLRLFVGEVLGGRIIVFDAPAAERFAAIVTDRRARGRPLSQFDGMVAAIAATANATIATRNVSDFEDCGIDVVNPWAG
jgi:predicted nucleic acid-binding protein